MKLKRAKSIDMLKRAQLSEIYRYTKIRLNRALSTEYTELPNWLLIADIDYVLWKFLCLILVDFYI